MTVITTKIDRQDPFVGVVDAFAAGAEKHDRLGTVAHESLHVAARAGLQTLTVPRAMGGLGAGLAETASVARRLGAADPAATLILAMTWIQHAHVAMERRWPERVYREVVRDAFAGRGLLNALRVEPELGTVMRGGIPASTARATPEGWRLSGRKIYSTGASVLNWYNVFARTDSDNPQVGYFLVRAGTPGTRIEAAWDHLGMRASDSHDVVFEDALVPKDYAVDVRPASAWRQVPPLHAAWFSLTVSAIYLGIADAARDWLIGFLRSRTPTNLGRPLATLERMQVAIGEIEALRTTAATMLASTARKADTTPAELSPEEPGLVKHLVSESAIEIVQKASALIGNPALTRAHPLERHLRDVLCARVHSPQSDSVLKAAGIAALGPFVESVAR
ncbi:MAG: acyl-CoA/acyl-ACP dehydrogenase [Xanthobacteraceae bacterium]|nr:acyl-CoA/acyl-ACP dehydrogenase [Xanthobacteraceae bacterium]